MFIYQFFNQTIQSQMYIFHENVNRPKLGIDYLIAQHKLNLFAYIDCEIKIYFQHD